MGDCMDIKEIGALVRAERVKQGFKQQEAAGFLNVGTRFLSDLENGKPTTQIGKVIAVLEGLGYELVPVPKGRQKLLRQVKASLNER